MHIRIARLADAIAIATLLAQLDYPGAEGFIAHKAEAMLAHPDAMLLVAEEDTGVLGVISLHFIPQLAMAGDFCRISYLCVSEQARGRGVGQVLESAAVQAAQARACDRIEVHCHARRTRAHGFYRTQGYEESPKYLMKRLLPPSA